jgi:ankyrin repeat protein
MTIDNENIFQMAENNDLNKLIVAIKDGACPNSIDELGRPLIFHSFNAEMFNTLIDLGADVFSTTPSQITTLHLAGILTNYMVIEKLVKAGVDINKKDDIGRTGLDYALAFAKSLTCYRSMHTIWEFIRNGADINKCDKGHYHPMIWDILKKLSNCHISGTCMNPGEPK